MFPREKKTSDLFVISAVQRSNVTALRHCLENGCSPDVYVEHPFKQYALHFACKGNVDYHIVKLLLDSDADPFCKDVFGRIPLHYLTQNWDITTADILTKAMQRHTGGAHADELKDCRGCTPLHLAYTVQDANSIGMRNFLSGWFDNRKSYDTNGHSPVALATLAGNMLVIEEHMTKFPDDWGCICPKNGETLFLVSAMGGRREVSEFIAVEGKKMGVFMH